jgi:N-carbamoyl-L-amino-acid hydrolase
MADAMTAAGHPAAQVGPDPETLRRVGTFVELHVEQGRALVDLGYPVAVGSVIWPHGRWRIDLDGEANHAGTTRLEDRRDPMLDLATTVLAARQAAKAQGCVATVGKVQVEPNGVNAIPSRVTAWLDARGPDEAGVRAVVASISAQSKHSVSPHSVSPHSSSAHSSSPEIRPVEESWTPETILDRPLAKRLSALLDDAPMLATGAGHDAGVLAAAGLSAAMLFVRNPTGISHSPAEFAERGDCHRGVEALTAVTEELSR